MSTASPTRTSAASAAVTPQGKTAAQVTSAPSRREFLYYIWGASIVMLLGQGTAGLVWFMLPRFKEGTFGGVFKFDPLRIPVDAGGAPISEPSGRFHVSHTPQGVVVLYGVCTHLGCLPRWVESNNRFECPCHGSKFELDGTYISGPAPRGMDVFSTTITFKDGTTISSSTLANNWEPLSLGGRVTTDIAEVSVNTGARIQRPPHP